jgi:predicted MFS family arabinose efflux permease
VTRLLTGVVDVRPLRSSPAFRRLWFGTTASTFSGQVAVVAVLFQVWELTHSSVWVGVIGVAEGLPMIAFGLLGGSLADRVDRRRLVLLSSAAAALAAVLLAVQAALDLRLLAPVLVLVAVQTASSALGSAARRSFVARLLPREQVPAGLALNHVSFQVAMLLGPAVAGAVLAGWGPTAAYVLDAVATAATLYGVARLPSMRADGPPDTARGGWSFLLRRPVLRGALLSDLASTVLAMPVALFPAINAERFGGDPRTLGLFLSAIAAGGILAGLGSGALTRARRPGRVSLVAGAVWGLALAGFGLADGVAVTLVCLAVAGAADTMSVIARGTVVQLDTPDSHRGRAGSAEYAVGAGGPALGNTRAGLVAGASTPELAALTGGLACVLAVAVIAATHPGLRRWTTADAVP